MLSKSDLKLMEAWREKQSTEQVNINDIKIVYDIHKNAIREGFESKSDNVSTYLTGRQIPVVVSPDFNGGYELLYGLGQWYKLKELEAESISVVIFNGGRDDLIKELRRSFRGTCLLSEIIVPESIKSNRPSMGELAKVAKSMLKGRVNPVIIDYESKELVGEYATYLLLKFRGVKRTKFRLSDK